MPFTELGGGIRRVVLNTLSMRGQLDGAIDSEFNYSNLEFSLGAQTENTDFRNESQQMLFKAIGL